jgi:hypothetical protein
MTTTILLLACLTDANTVYIRPFVRLEMPSGANSSGIVYKIHDYNRQPDGTQTGHPNKYALILTHAHGRKLHDTVTVWFNRSENSMGHSGEVVAIDDVRDLAVIACRSWPHIKLYPILPADQDPPGIGESVRFVGFGSMKKPATSPRYTCQMDDRHTTITDNNFTVHDRDKDYRDRKYPHLTTAADARGGDSGSPLIWKGHIAGTMWGYRTDKSKTDHDAIFVRHTEIWAFLKEIGLEP